MNLAKMIEQRSQAFKEKSSIDLTKVSQGSEEWLKAKLGVISASNAYKVVSKGRGNEPSKTRRTYMLELCAQVATGVFEEVNSKHMEWGRNNEDAARSSYEFALKKEVYETAFIFKDDSFRCGVSVDGIVVQDETALELKCPYNSVHFLDFILDEEMKNEWEWQCQFGMWVTKTKNYHMAQFDPRMKKTMFHYIDVPFNPEMQAKLDVEVPKFIAEMDAILAKLGFKFGEQWERLK